MMICGTSLPSSNRWRVTARMVPATLSPISSNDTKLPLLRSSGSSQMDICGLVLSWSCRVVGARPGADGGLGECERPGFVGGLTPDVLADGRLPPQRSDTC